MTRSFAASVRLLLIVTLSVGGSALAEEHADQPGFLERAGKGADAVTTWTREKAKQGWTATKESAGDVADWTAEKAAKGADAATEGAEKAADWAADKAHKRWKTTRETGKSFWQKTKEFFTGNGAD